MPPLSQPSNKEVTKQFTKLTDYPWAILSPFLPFKRKRNLDLCDVMNAILWLLRTSCHGAARAVAELTQ
ncbi:hypothetical protein GCM10027185_59320 [Spirosoma pulveris]